MLCDQMKKTRNNHIAGTKFNRKIVERDTIDTPNAQMHDRSLCWLGIGTSIKNNGGVKLI
jgi:hypothetical protein